MQDIGLQSVVAPPLAWPVDVTPLKVGRLTGSLSNIVKSNFICFLGAKVDLQVNTGLVFLFQNFNYWKLKPVYQIKLFDVLD